MRQYLLFTRIAQIILGANILFFLGTGVLILLTPMFFHSIVNFLPYNRHYLVDGGIFQMALGLGLLWAIFSPAKRVAHIWIATIASILHAGNHLYDTLFVSTPLFLSGWLVQTVFLFVMALGLLAVALWYRGPSKTASSSLSERTERQS